MFALLASRASADGPAAGKPADLPTVTVQASRDAKRLKQQIGKFVSSITKSSRVESLARWQVPVCPLVAGVTRNQGEYFLERLSQVARDAGAPLAPEKCAPNFLVMITAQPDELLQLWQDRTPHLFSRDRGAGAVRRFLRSDLAVRVWYNANNACAGKETTFSIQSNVLSSSCRSSGLASRLTRPAVRVIGSVIVVIDAERVKSFKIRQVIDYVAMLGFSEIREHLEPVDAPSVLNLFADSMAEKPTGMSSWDRAFLKSLYRVDAVPLSQASEIKLQIFRDLVAEQARDPKP